MRGGVLLAVVACCWANGLGGATVSVYYDQASWQAAMSLNGTNPLTSISFSSSLWTSSLVSTATSTSLVSQARGAASNGMALSFVSGYSEPGLVDNSTLGQVSNGEWTDNLSKYGTTVLNFSSPIYGLGGHFDISGGNGLFIQPIGMTPYPDYSGIASFESAYASYDGFIGFATDAPLTSVLITWGESGSCYPCFGNSYTLSDLQVETLPTPEPDFGILWGTAAFLGITCKVFRSRRSPGR